MTTNSKVLKKTFLIMSGITAIIAFWGALAYFVHPAFMFGIHFCLITGFVYIAVKDFSPN